ncbi:MAG: cation diffusion facilitator family transporter [Candidatus Microthrix parvicella]|uniref:cation diffusion facilitator family transporter n=1 Tax=Candidatus Neomicrothrix parvicella TaxID=41950 RepID=UPI0003709C2D|nr:cation diffusion facilitator family transporter [Candidatus Microthrix parvicella]
MTNHGDPGSVVPLDKSSRRHRNRLVVAFGLSAVFLVAEVVAAILTDSLALWAGAGHMLADVVGMGMALSAIGLVERQRRRHRIDPSATSRVLGPYRLEMAAAFITSVALAAVAVYVVVDGIGRLFGESGVRGLGMLVVATAGLLVNLATFVLLREGDRVSLNLSGDSLEVLADTLDTMGVIVAALMLDVLGWAWADSVVGVALALWLVPRAHRLGRHAMRILLRDTPPDLDVGELEQTLRRFEGVVDVRDLRVWTLSSELDAASVHLVVVDAEAQHSISEHVRELFEHHCDISHGTVTLSVENQSEGGQPQSGQSGSGQPQSEQSRSEVRW